MSIDCYEQPLHIAGSDSLTVTSFPSSYVRIWLSFRLLTEFQQKNSSATGKLD